LKLKTYFKFLRGRILILHENLAVSKQTKNNNQMPRWDIQSDQCIKKSIFSHLHQMGHEDTSKPTHFSKFNSCSNTI